MSGAASSGPLEYWLIEPIVQPASSVRATRLLVR